MHSGSALQPDPRFLSSLSWKQLLCEADYFHWCSSEVSDSMSAEAPLSRSCWSTSPGPEATGSICLACSATEAPSEAPASRHVKQQADSGLQKLLVSVWTFVPSRLSWTELDWARPAVSSGSRFMQKLRLPQQNYLFSHLTLNKKENKLFPQNQV